MPQTRRLLMVLALNLGLVAALVVAGVTAHSLAVLAEGGDYLLDAAGVSVALLAIWLSARPAGGVRRDGAPSASNVAALINSGWLLVLEILVAAAAVDRLASGIPQVQGLPVLIVSGIAAFVMTGGALILRGEDKDDANEHDLSMAAVLLDTIADAAAAAGVAVTGAVNPGHRRLVLAGPCSSARHRSRRRLPRRRIDPKSPHPAQTRGSERQW